MILIEGLIAILIFSIGILALIGLQATAIKQTGDAKLRADASYLANQIISQMWIDRANISLYSHQATGSNCAFSGAQSTHAPVVSWLGDAIKRGTLNGSLPNASAQILVDGLTGVVTVTVCWRAPQETETHNFTSTARIQA